MNPTPQITALTATIVFLGTFGLLLVVGGFGVIRVGNEILEALGALPPRWGENNLMILVGAAGVVSAPIVLWASAWFYRKALAGEQRMEIYDAQKG